MRYLAADECSDATGVSAPLAEFVLRSRFRSYLSDIGCYNKQVKNPFCIKKRPLYKNISCHRLQPYSEELTTEKAVQQEEGWRKDSVYKAEKQNLAP